MEVPKHLLSLPTLDAADSDTTNAQAMIVDNGIAMITDHKELSDDIYTLRFVSLVCCQRVNTEVLSFHLFWAPAIS